MHYVDNRVDVHSTKQERPVHVRGSISLYQRRVFNKTFKYIAGAMAGIRT